MGSQHSSLCMDGSIPARPGPWSHGVGSPCDKSAANEIARRARRPVLTWAMVARAPNAKPVTARRLVLRSEMAGNPCGIAGRVTNGSPYIDHPARAPGPLPSLRLSLVLNRQISLKGLEFCPKLLRFSSPSSIISLLTAFNLLFLYSSFNVEPLFIKKIELNTARGGLFD